MSLTAGASIMGRLFLGSIADRSDKRFLAMFCFLVQGAAVLSMAYFRQSTVLYLGTLAFGLTMGGIVMLQSLLIGECFGMVSFGTVSGLSGVFSMAGAAFGPMIAGLIFDATRDYRIAFTIFAAGQPAGHGGGFLCPADSRERLIVNDDDLAKSQKTTFCSAGEAAFAGSPAT